MTRWPPAIDRFLARVTVLGPDDCWPWDQPGPDGYGHMDYDGRTQGAHRFAYEHHVGPVPPGLTLDHLCHTRDLACPGGPTCPHRRCCNPSHLEPVTRADNLRRGRAGRPQASRTHCPAGHAYAEHGVRYPGSGGRRECRECKRLRSVRYYQDHKEPTPCP